MEIELPVVPDGAEAACLAIARALAARGIDVDVTVYRLPWDWTEVWPLSAPRDAVFVVNLGVGDAPRADHAKKALSEGLNPATRRELKQRLDSGQDTEPGLAAHALAVYEPARHDWVRDVARIAGVWTLPEVED